MSHQIRLSEACKGMILYKQAAGRSDHTLADYCNSFKKLQLHFDDDPPINSITHHQLIEFFAWLQDDHVSEPDGVAPRGKIKLSPKSIKNIHTNLSALWGWAVKESYVDENLLRSIDTPRVFTPPVEPFSKDDVIKILRACDRSRSWKQRNTTNARPTAERDAAMILLLLDTGLRASELCGITFSDLNLNTRTIKVRGKGNKERIVPFSKRTRNALWKYILPRLEENIVEEVFVVGQGENIRPMNRNVLYKQIKRLGKKAGVPNAHPHRFRHTFTIHYLRNGADVFTLQALLGHSDLATVKRYVRIAQVTSQKRIRKPARWRIGGCRSHVDTTSYISYLSDA